MAPTLSDDLGDYGVFWDPDAETGVVWANVDHASEFAAGIVMQSEPEDIPTTSEWGLVVMTLVLLAAGKVYFGRRRPTAANE